VTAASSDARELAKRARDRVRFEEDALTYADDAYRVARRLAGSTEAAEELVQDAYVRAFRSWEQYTPGTNLRAWLLRIVHNLAVDAGRKRQRTPQMEPVEESDYYLYQRMGGTSTPEEADTGTLARRLMGEAGGHRELRSVPSRSSRCVTPMGSISHSPCSISTGCATCWLGTSAFRWSTIALTQS